MTWTRLSPRLKRAAGAEGDVVSGKQIVVGITGASGALYAGRLLRALLIGGHQVHLVLSKYGRYLLVEELGFRPDKESLRVCNAVLRGGDPSW